MKPITNKFLFVLFLSALSLKGFAQNNWELSKDQNGIKVYTRNSDSSAFKSVKVEAVLEGTPGKLTDILMGIERNIKWVYNTKTLRLIKRYNPNELLYYAETSLPWPMRI